ncbi:hypothetical protein QAD02_008727 [Eretmocerus hayati]|uniref:Uncharacterized protein n=1 Tax=Eretmocerus hayati TaxID=131215 RepID=A0ACC2NBR5_9HYME|nr:hypothetical protein QAD02_008727 [Eretmocerus hayati]
MLIVGTKETNIDSSASGGYSAHSMESKSPEAKNFRHLYGAYMSADTNLLVEDYTFFVHRIVLVTNSPALSPIMTPHLGEKQKICIPIQDFSPKVVAKMITYMYLNIVSDIKDVVFDLYRIAERYDLKGLMNICLECIRKELNMENAMAILSFAVQNNIEKLVEDTKNFIKLHSDRVLDSNVFEPKMMKDSANSQQSGL